MHSISGSTTFSTSSDEHTGSDRMELEAAEALAELAQVVATTRQSSESGTSKWGSKGKRARSGCLVKSESLHVDSPDLALNSSNHPVNMEDSQVGETDIHEGFKKAKIKQQAKFLNPSLTCEVSTTSFGCSRSRKNLTEAEKEEKRLRRVLANRESARQTIRRRQALHEELSRKASDLLIENVDLKREKELALKKLRSLKNDNELLKTQMSQSVDPGREKFLQGVQNTKPTVEENLLQLALNIKSEVDESLDLKLAHPDVSSTKNSSKVYCNEPPAEHSQLTPCLSPPMAKSLNSDQSAPVTCIPMFTSSRNTSDKKPYTVNTPLTPVYILPYPWFIPSPYHSDAKVPHDSSAPDNGIYITVAGSVSSKSETVENPHSTLILQAKTEVSDLKDNAPDISSDVTPFLHMINGHGAGGFGGHTPGSVHILPNISSDPAHVLHAGKHETWLAHDYSHLEGLDLFPEPQKNKERAYFFPAKITDHSAAAAEAEAKARKRRKELDRFKNLTGRQYQLPC